jgi:hypothetical protein
MTKRASIHQLDVDAARAMVSELLELKAKSSYSQELRLGCFLAGLAGYIREDMPRLAAVLTAAYMDDEQPLAVHAAADMRGMRSEARRTACGQVIHELPRGQLWSGRADHVTCQQCKGVK